MTASTLRDLQRRFLNTAVELRDKQGTSWFVYVQDIVYVDYVFSVIGVPWYPGSKLASSDMQVYSLDDYKLLVYRPPLGYFQISPTQALYITYKPERQWSRSLATSLLHVYTLGNSGANETRSLPTPTFDLKRLTIATCVLPKPSKTRLTARPPGSSIRLSAEVAGVVNRDASGLTLYYKLTPVGTVTFDTKLLGLNSNITTTIATKVKEAVYANGSIM